jgi:hypothetical protein
MNILKAFDLNSKILRKIKNFDREDFFLKWFSFGRGKIS